MSSRDQSPARASEQTPLLSRTDSSGNYDEANGHIETEPAPSKPKRKWPIIAALSTLTVAVILALVFGFVMPSSVEEYAKQAMSFEADKIEVDSFTDAGVRVHVQGTVWMDADKVKKASVRNLGRFAFSIAKQIEAGESTMHVYLPAYDDVLLGSATVPPFKLDIRNGHYNYLDMIIDCEPGDPAGFRKLAQNFMDGKKDDLLVKAIAEVPVKAGIFNVGMQKSTQLITVPQRDAPKLPEPHLDNLKVAQHGPKGHPDGIKAWAELSVDNPFPVKLDVPPVTMQVLLRDCHDGYDLFATTTSGSLHIVPKQKLNISAVGFMTKLPTSLTSACPGSDRSPLDDFIASYLKGEEATVYIRGGHQGPDTPAWIGNLLQDTVLPVPLPPKPAFDQSIKNFSLTHVHFSLPETQQERPVLSATVNVLVGLPEGMNFDVDVNRVRSDGAIYYEGQEMSKLDLSAWQNATSRKVNGDLLVSSQVVNAPLDIVNEDVFARVVKRMVFEKKAVPLEIRATVDVDATTALGTFVVSGIPSKGKILIDPPQTDGFKHEVKEISVVTTTPQSLTMQARVKIDNPTDYYAHMPGVNVSLYVNNTRMGYAWASADIKPGENELLSYVRWDKSKIGAEFMSQYISGYNVSLTIAQFDGSIPGMPNLGINVTVPMPHMFGRFLKDTTIYLLSATATFVLFSPIPMWITTIHSTAYYNGTNIGNIDYEYPFVVEVGDTETPRLPVDWKSPGSGLIRDALGGRLKIDALAHCGIKIGDWRDEIWFEGKSLGAHVRL